MKRVAIVGGGVTGLAAAWELEKISDAEIDLYEAADRLGGKLQTQRRDGFLIEEGPDCFFASKPGMREIVEELGITDQLIEPQVKEFSILFWKSHPAPRGLINLRNPSPDAIRATTLLTESEKARALAPQPVLVESDISIREFFSARFGPGFSRAVAEPLLAGTHGGNPDRLSMRSLYPAYLSEAPVEVVAGGGPTFLSFRDGMQTLIRALAGALCRTRVHVAHPVRSIPEADRVLFAVPAPAAARILPQPLAGLIGAIRHLDAQIVTVASELEASELPRETGFLASQGDDQVLTGATWSSVKWAGRAPEGAFLARYFLPPDVDPQSVEGAFHRVSRNRILFTLQTCLPEALPQYEVGHLDRLVEIEDAMRAFPDIFLAGTSYRGVGVPDCLRQGREAARKIADSL